MELKTLGKKLAALAAKYKYVILVLVIGLALMLLPSGEKDDSTPKVTESKVKEIQDTLSQQLSDLLTQIDGAGQVQVLLTKGEGEETVYQTDTDISQTESDAIERKTTVTITDAERTQSGLIRQVNPPKYLGAIVVCEGADNPTVRLAIADAVSKATGLGTNCISVLKMK